ncbi:universal stress protein [Sulfitobacter sp. JL08]|uniref:universal stress protein n=1 Tax=Sulfitobacter sp. JL08 TaxID=2070369 RepID=UPI000E0A4952|nr:universal stress protein [Sulfitobacter sp. JL08]AXI54137.1 universal stress protein [Sulfitobacter sp. JL08]
MFKTVLVATDGSDTANRALDAAIDQAVRQDARLYIVHVRLHGRPVEELEHMAEIEHIVPEYEAQASSGTVPFGAALRNHMSDAGHEARIVGELGELILKRAKQRALEAGVKKVDTLSEGGDYADSILDAIDETGADLVVLGRRGLGKVRQFLIGSVSNKVAQHAGSAVLLIQ